MKFWAAKTVLFFLCAAILFSCNKSSALFVSHEPARAVPVNQNDEAILQIAQDARNTLPGFFRHLTRRGKGEHDFCVKYSFFADDGSSVNEEQVWFTGIQFKNGIYYGVLANAPQYLDDMKKGDKIIFEPDAITDWMYIRDGKIIGGQSIKYLLEKVPEDQRSDRDSELLEMFEK